MSSPRKERRKSSSEVGSGAVPAILVAMGPPLPPFMSLNVAGDRRQAPFDLQVALSGDHDGAVVGGNAQRAETRAAGHDSDVEVRLLNIRGDDIGISFNLDPRDAVRPGAMCHPGHTRE